MPVLVLVLLRFAAAVDADADADVDAVDADIHDAVGDVIVPGASGDGGSDGGGRAVHGCGGLAGWRTLYGRMTGTTQALKKEKKEMTEKVESKKFMANSGQEKVKFFFRYHLSFAGNGMACVRNISSIRTHALQSATKPLHADDLEYARRSTPTQ